MHAMCEIEIVYKHSTRNDFCPFNTYKAEISFYIHDGDQRGFFYLKSS